MQDYHSFVRDLRQAIAGIGQRLPSSADVKPRLTMEQWKRFRGNNMMTDERVAYLNCAGGPEGFGPAVVEVSHGAFLNNRIIGLTVFHQIAHNAEHDFDQSGCFHSIGEAVERLRQLDGGE